MSGWLAQLMGIGVLATTALAMWVAVRGWPKARYEWFGLLGEAYLFGILGFGSALWFTRPSAVSGAAISTLLGSVAITAICLPAIWHARHRHDRRPTRGALRTSGPVQAFDLPVVLLLSLLAVSVFAQALTLPTLTWDAWNAWLAKSKSWVIAGTFHPFVPLDAWLAEPAVDQHSAVGAVYPEALPRAVAGLVGIADVGWSDAHAHVFWPLLWVALGGILYASLRRFGVERGWTEITVVTALSLPMVSAHASLPGYADLWLATAILALGVNSGEYVQTRKFSRLFIAAIWLLTLPLIKLEGAIYAGIFVVASVLWWAPAAVRWVLLLLATPLLILASMWWTLAVPLPGLGWIEFRWGAVTVPWFGTLELYWRPVGGTVLESLFLLPNWSILWYALIPVAVLKWRTFRQLEWSVLGTFLVGAAGFHTLLFLFTDASIWAESLTSLNRLLLHTTPLLLFTLVAVFNQRRPRPYGRHSE